MSGRETHGVLIKFSVILCVQNTVYDNRVLNIIFEDAVQININLGNIDPKFVPKY